MLDSRNVRVCRRCLLEQEIEKEEAQMISKYLEYIKPEDLAGDVVYSRRISHCQMCEYRQNATCQACGCYIEFRANIKNGRCPKKRWD